MVRTTEPMEPGSLGRDEVFERLEALGIGEARVPYYGSHDESFVEAAELYAEGTDAGNVSPGPRYVLGDWSGFVPGGGPEELGDEDADVLREALEEPIYEKLGDAFGDSVDGVDGVAVWKVAERRVVIEHGYLDWRHEDIEA